MLTACEGPGFAQEARTGLIVSVFGRQNLQGDASTQTFVECEIHLAHSSGAQRALDDIGTDAGSRGQQRQRCFLRQRLPWVGLWLDAHHSSLVRSGPAKKSRCARAAADHEDDDEAEDDAVSLRRWGPRFRTDFGPVRHGDLCSPTGLLKKARGPRCPDAIEHQSQQRQEFSKTRADGFHCLSARDRRARPEARRATPGSRHSCRKTPGAQNRMPHRCAGERLNNRYRLWRCWI